MSSSESDHEQDDKQEEEFTLEGLEAWQSLGVCDEVAQTAVDLKWNKPTAIQQKSIPIAIEGKDVIGLAETGSGKTAAFAIPVLQVTLFYVLKLKIFFFKTLLKTPGGGRLSCLVMTPTRELAFQIREQFQALGSAIGLSCACIVGGIEMMSQQLALAKKPHVIVATPGRLVDHLEKTRGFNLKALKFLIMDEADRILNLDFEAEVDKEWIRKKSKISILHFSV